MEKCLLLFQPNSVGPMSNTCNQFNPLFEINAIGH